MKWVSIAVVSSTVALFGCDKHDDSMATKATTAIEGVPDAASPMAMPTAAAPLSSDDKDFITNAAQGGMLEVALGQVAAKNASAADVKAFAGQMVTDHSKIDDSLMVLAGKKGYTPPGQLDSSKQSKVADFQKLTGPKLDAKYAADMVEDHEDDVKEFQKASNDLKDPDLKAFAAMTLPTLQHHLEMAKAMNGKIKDAGH